MQFIKNHWFGLIISLMFGFFLLVFFLVLIAPHNDAEQRGFTRCTQEMSETLLQCDKSGFCILGGVAKNTFCNIGVIFEGLGNWLRGEQSTPFSNFLFEVEEQEEELEAELLEFYEQNPDFRAQMNELRELNLDLEKMYEEKK